MAERLDSVLAGIQEVQGAPCRDTLRRCLEPGPSVWPCVRALPAFAWIPPDSSRGG